MESLCPKKYDTSATITNRETDPNEDKVGVKKIIAENFPFEAAGVSQKMGQGVERGG